MNVKSLFLFCCALLALSVLVACGNNDVPEESPVEEPTAVSDSTDSISPTATQELSQSVIGVANVDSIEVLILESFPVQIEIKARGSLPNGCTTIDNVSIDRAGNEFNVAIATLQDAGQVCTQALVPFEETIPLDVEGLPAGSYQVNVNGRTGSFTLSVDNVAGALPTAVPEPTETPESVVDLALVNGRVWHDLCAIATNDDGSSTPSEGCIAQASGDSFQANGLLEGTEPGLPDVIVNLGEGTCPSVGLDSVTTDEDGDFLFIDLPAGEYCISIEATDAANALVLEDGLWTFPESGSAETAVTLDQGEVLTGINFGWDYAFLPTPDVDLANCTNSFEFIEDVNIPDDTVFTAGQTFEKRWRLENNGTCPWNENYALAFLDGPLVPDESTIPLTSVVVPGQTVEVSAAFTAPEILGTYRSNWQLQDSNGNLFGVNGLLEEAFWVQIVVGEAEATPIPGSGTIGGVVWDDICFINTDGTASAGCEEIEDSGFFRGDGSLNFNDGRLADITVILLSGGCSADGSINPANILATAVTDSAGLYRFTGLEADTYCVAIDALSDDNVDLLIPGDWTWPFAGVGRQGVFLESGEELLEIDFGWDFRE